MLVHEEIAAVLACLERAEEFLTTPAEACLVLPRGPPGVRVLIVDGEFPVPGVLAFGWPPGVSW